MPIIRSFGSLQSIGESYAPTWGQQGALNFYGSFNHTYAQIYRAQPNVRTVVDFLGRNIAQLGLHVFRRQGDTDRIRLADHELAGWLAHPNPATTRYRLIESTLIDLGIYFNAYWLKVRADPLGLVRLPPEQMCVEGTLLPETFVWTDATGEKREFAPSEIVHFGGYDPSNPRMGLSPLETLRRVLAEEFAAGEYREGFWKNAARMEGTVTRPKEVPPYTKEQAASWRKQWQEAYAGGAGSGKTMLLQQGEVFTPISFSAKDSEYLSARKLSREECAAAYHVPLPMVGILDHATFSNIKEQHKHLYQDCLGPWLEMIVEEIERQLLIECRDQRDIYLEFNIAKKLEGSFEEQAAALQMAVGKPWMKVNEARAKQNLSKDDDPESDRIAPQQGGPADSAAPADEPTAVDIVPVIQATQARIMSRLAKLPVQARASAFVADLDRWDRELSDDLAALTGSADELTLAKSLNGQLLDRLKREGAYA